MSDSTYCMELDTVGLAYARFQRWLVACGIRFAIIQVPGPNGYPLVRYTGSEEALRALATAWFGFDGKEIEELGLVQEVPPPSPAEEVPDQFQRKHRTVAVNFFVADATAQGAENVVQWFLDCTKELRDKIELGCDEPEHLDHMEDE